MKTLHFLTCGLALMLLTSCNAISSLSRNANPLVLKLEIAQNEVNSYDEIKGQVSLLNQGDSSVLVHRRLLQISFPAAPPSMAEMLILISDSSGNLIFNEYSRPNYELPDDATLGVLKPGEKIQAMVYLNGLGFYAEMFKRGEPYSIVAIYQNGLDITKILDGEEVSAWVGSVRSNEETFVILP